MAARNTGQHTLWRMVAGSFFYLAFLAPLWAHPGHEGHVRDGGIGHYFGESSHLAELVTAIVFVLLAHGFAAARRRSR